MMRAIALSLVGTVALATAGIVWFSTSDLNPSGSSQGAAATAADTDQMPESSEALETLTGKTITQIDTAEAGLTINPPPSIYTTQAAKELFDPVCQSDGFVVETCDCLFTRLVTFGGADVPAYIGLIGFDRLSEADEIEQRLGERLLGAATKIYGEGEYKACAIESGPGSERGGEDRVLRAGDPLPERPLTPAEEFARLCPEGTPEVPGSIGYIAAVFENGKRLSGPHKQRTGISRALSLKQKCLLMDEPVSDLDPIDAFSLDVTSLDAQDFDLTVWTVEGGASVRTLNPGDLISVSSELTVIGVAPDQEDWADLTLSRMAGNPNLGVISIETPTDWPFLFLDHLGNRSAYWTYSMVESGRSGEIEISEITPVENGTAKIECSSEVSIDCEFPPRACTLEKAVLDANRFNDTTQTYRNLLEIVEAIGGCGSPQALANREIQAVPNLKNGFDWIISTERENAGDLILIDPR